MKSIDNLEKAATKHKISQLPGMKAKTEENILQGIALVKRGKERMPLAEAKAAAKPLIAYLKKSKTASSICLAGSMRRWKESVKDIDILAVSQKPTRVIEIFTHYPEVQKVLAQGETKSSILLANDLQVDLRVVSKDSYGAALHYFTGSKEHNVHLRQIALTKGLKINEYGVFRQKTNRKIAGTTEKQVYQRLGLPYIEPELREDQGEIEAASSGTLPWLVTLKDIKGDLHSHTTYSDGQSTLVKLAQAAKAKGYEYLAITEHSASLTIAGGLKPKDLLRLHKEIKKFNARIKKIQASFRY